MTSSLSFSRRLALLVFTRRPWILAFFIASTAVMAYFASQIGLDASFIKMIPTRHPYIKTFLKHAPEFGGGNRIVVSLVSTNGDIFNANFFNTLKNVTEDMMYLKGIDPGKVKSIFSNSVRYWEIVEDGFDGSTVIPPGFSGTARELRLVEENLVKSGQLGLLVSHDFRAAMVMAEVTEFDPDTGEKLDPYNISKSLEESIRAKYQSPAISIHILGFAKLIGEIKEKGKSGLNLCLITVLLTLGLLLLYTRSWVLSLTPLFCALLSCLWLLGSMKLVGYGLDPMSVVIVFLIFAIAVSHAIQKINTFRLELEQVPDCLTASRSSFEKLFAPGMIALTTDNAGFLTILFIPIPVVREIAISANLGAVAIALINLFLLPVILSYLPVSFVAHARQGVRREGSRAWATRTLWSFLGSFVEPRQARWAAVLTVLALIPAVWFGKDLQIGDVHPGSPELRPSSAYNRDVVAIRNHFTIGGDLLVVYAETQPEACTNYSVLSLVDEFSAHMDRVDGVLMTFSLPKLGRRGFVVFNEGNPKWYGIPRDIDNLRMVTGGFGSDTGLVNFEGSVMPVLIFVKDHMAQTIRTVVDAVKDFNASHPRSDVTLALAGGNIAIDAATNEVLRDSQGLMLILFYGMSLLIIYFFFRSWQSMVCIIIPLSLVSLFTYAVMTVSGIGLKVATLPIISVGAGVGMDYAVYMYGGLRQFLLGGDSVRDAYHKALRSTGKAVFFTACTLSVGTGAWIFSDLKLQADMGLLFAFTFVGNMIAALILLPALAYFLFQTKNFANQTDI